MSSRGWVAAAARRPAGTRDFDGILASDAIVLGSYEGRRAVIEGSAHTLQWHARRLDHHRMPPYHPVLLRRLPDTQDYLDFWRPPEHVPRSTADITPIGGIAGWTST